MFCKIFLAIYLISKGSGNYKNFDKMHVKSFPNFTHHHLITHTNNTRQTFILGIFIDDLKSLSSPGPLGF